MSRRLNKGPASPFVHLHGRREEHLPILQQLTHTYLRRSYLPPGVFTVFCSCRNGRAARTDHPPASWISSSYSGVGEIQSRHPAIMGRKLRPWLSGGLTDRTGADGNIRPSRDRIFRNLQGATTVEANHQLET